MRAVLSDHVVMGRAKPVILDGVRLLGFRIEGFAETPRKAFKQIAARLSVSSGGQGRFGIGNRTRAAPEWFDRHFITATSC